MVTEIFSTDNFVIGKQTLGLQSSDISLANQGEETITIRPSQRILKAAIATHYMLNTYPYRFKDSFSNILKMKKNKKPPIRYLNSE